MNGKLKQLILTKKPLTKEDIKIQSPDVLSLFSQKNKSQQIIFTKRTNNNNSSITNNSLLNQSSKNEKNLFLQKIKKKNNFYNIKSFDKFHHSINTTKKRKNRKFISPKKKINTKKKVLKFNINPVKNKTIFEKIIDDVGKIKIKTNRTLNIIKKNVKIANKEVSNRKNHLSFEQLVKEGFKIQQKMNQLEQNDDTNNNNYYSFNYSSNINSMDLPEEQLKKNNSLGMIKIPFLSLSAIRQKRKLGYSSLDKMHHYRNFRIPDEFFDNKFEKLHIINTKGSKEFFKEKKLQFIDIFNKINLVMDNIDYFKKNYMYRAVFYSAFDNMQNKQKAEFNSVLEEISVILMKIVPRILKKFYENLDLLLYASIPDISQEMEKEPENEKECLNLNYMFFNTVTFYFLGCIEILKEIESKMVFFKYSLPEYTSINNYLNLARYDTSKINSMAKAHISKTIKDKEILDKFEVGLGLKPKKVFFNDDLFERLHKRANDKQLFENTTKINRINSALNLSNKSNNYSKLNNFRKTGKIGFEKKDRKYLLNNPMVMSMMKYFKNSVKSQIISQQVIERYKAKE